ncbi:MAG: PAS domain S-box protein [Alphaproteobacteria bacterium]|nr:PAS domain S-box protein [Alphaproteobacteria bacterium]
MSMGPAAPDGRRSHERSDRTVMVLAVVAVSLALFTSAAGTGPLALPLSIAALLVAAGALVLVFLQRKREHTRSDRYSLILGTLEDAASGHLVTDSAGSVVFVNPAATSLLGGTRPDRLSDFEIMVAADERDMAEFNRMRRGAEDGGMTAVKFPHQEAEGTAWWLVSAKPLEDLPGHIHWQLQDVTAQHRRETALQAQQAKLIAFMDQAPVGFYSVDATGRFLFANATLADWLGVSPEDLIDGACALGDFRPDGTAADAPAYSLLRRDSGTGTGEVSLRGRDGRFFQAFVTETAVRGMDGAPVEVRSLVRDLTPEREIREALRASEARFQRFFEDAPIGVALLDPAMCLTEWNRAFVQLVGGGGQALDGTPITELLREQAGRIGERLAAVLAGTDMESPLEVQVQTGSGDLSVQLFAKRLEDGTNETVGLLLQFIDQTEQRRLEAQFTQSQKMQAVGQLAGGIAHDFNNLLTAMIGFSDLLLLRHKPGDPSFGDIMQIKQNANRAANLVRQLLAFSRQQTLQPRVLNITDALADLSNLLRRLIGENIELKMVHGRDLGLVKVDQGQLEQVIINLAVNARDAMPAGGRLTIATRNVTTVSPTRRGSEEMPPGAYVAIEVTDTGIGIPAENLNRIFDPFFSTKEVGAGTGLGLSTVYGIVRQTGGYVFVDSKPDAGARFTIHLPLYQETAESRADSHPSGEPQPRDLTGAGRILLVEDEDPVRMFSARALRNKGYEVIEARSGDQALDHLKENDEAIDLLITDVVMPKIDGPTLIRMVRERRPDIKVICISGYAEDKFRDQMGAGSATHFLAKPFSLKQLAARVKDVMDQPPGKA